MSQCLCNDLLGIVPHGDAFISALDPERAPAPPPPTPIFLSVLLKKPFGNIVPEREDAHNEQSLFLQTLFSNFGVYQNLIHCLKIRWHKWENKSW